MAGRRIDPIDSREHLSGVCRPGDDDDVGGREETAVVACCCGLDQALGDAASEDHTALGGDVTLLSFISV